MISKDLLLKVLTYVSFYEFGMIFFDDKTLIMIFAVFGYCGIEIYLTILNRQMIITGEYSEKTNDFTFLYASNLPNTLVIDNKNSLHAISGLLFISAVDSEDYLGNIRLQDQFSIIHLENQLGSIYLYCQELVLGKPLGEFGRKEQTYFLTQISKGLINFQKVMSEMLPGFKTRLLTIEEISDECGFNDYCKNSDLFSVPSEHNSQFKVNPEATQIIPTDKS